MARRAERKRYVPPLVKPRSTWSEDEIRRDSLMLAKLIQTQPEEPKPLRERQPRLESTPAPEP
jgi:hypothetical protein